MSGNAGLPHGFLDADLLDIPATPIVFNASMATAKMANVLLIDSTLADKQVFYDSANANTFPIIYDYNSKTDDLLALFREKFPASSIQRITLAFHGRGANFMAAFMNNKPFFQESDLAKGQTSFSDNVSFLVSCIKEFSVTHIDFLACNTLQYSNWKSYYALLAAQTSVVVGASNDKTGNLNYGGDWVMESTHENVRDLYFNASISNYASTLAAINISADGASQAIYLQMSGADMQYSIGSVPGSWTTIASGDWPVTIQNSNPGPSSILRVAFTQDLTISGTYGNTLGYFIAGSTYVTFDGSNNFINIANITNYLGLIKNGSTATTTNGFANVIVQNIKTNVTGTSTLSTAANARAGWICASSFGRGAAANQIINCTNNGPIPDLCGGICGERAAVAGGNVTMTNCQNTGNITSSMGFGGGGIVGFRAGESGTLYMAGCTNSGVISGKQAGGIAGQQAGQANTSAGSATFVNCTNTGDISGISAGGIAGAVSGFGTASLIGSATFTNCSSTGAISGQYSGGFVGPGAGYTTITNCYSTGVITGQYAGGIAGSSFAANTNQPCSISNSYSTGAISGNNAGGIVGTDVGYNDNALYTPVVNITNSYSLGAIATTSGGIVGGTDPSLNYINKANINITNCYSFGALTGTGTGLVGATLTSTYINLTATNTYVAAGTWSDATAIANLTGTPTNINTNNPGATWTTLAADTPYVLSVYNAALYSPSSASSFINYTSAQGLFQSGYTYQLVYTSQAGTAATARVFSSKGTAPYYNSYNLNTFTLTNLNGGSGSPISATINASNGVLDFILPYPCFLEGTKILCLENDQEVYRPVESLRKGDLVKTIYNGYMPIHMIGTTALYNPGNDYRVANRLYKCPREKYPALFEDLYITGCHSILVPRMTNDQWENTKAVNGDVFVTDNHFRLIACADEKAEPFNKEGFMNIYHIALEHHDVLMNYGIYANGLLVESCSERNLRYLSNMRILGEEDCSVYQDVDKELIRQLVETY